MGADTRADKNSQPASVTPLPRRTRKGVVLHTGRLVEIEESDDGRIRIEIAGIMGITEFDGSGANGKTMIELYAPRH